MGSQSEVFTRGEGKAWLDRNINKLTGDNDPVLETLTAYKIAPTTVIEVGCANGWRLKKFAEKFNCHGFGVDPGAERQVRKGFSILNGTADHLPFTTASADMVIYGFCLYLCDPEDYFKIATEGSRVLENNGYLVVYDFNCPIGAYKTNYRHHGGIFSHHYDFSRLWLGHPDFSVYGRKVFGPEGDETCVTVLKKNTGCFVVK